MNEFTKKELSMICEWAKDSRNNAGHDSWVKNGNHVLFVKIQSLIDNYCEHKETENNGGWTYKCIKCGMKFGDETQ